MFNFPTNGTGRLQVEYFCQVETRSEKGRRGDFPVNIYPLWLPTPSCEFLLERHPWISRMGTCSRGEPHTCDSHMAPEWSVKFPIASPCTWSLSVSSNSCLKTLIILNFPQSVWKYYRRIQSWKTSLRFFAIALTHQGGSSPWTHWSLRTLQISLFHALFQRRGFFENNEFQRSLFSQLWPRQTPLLPLPMTSSTKALSGTQTMRFPE